MTRDETDERVTEPKTVEELEATVHELRHRLRNAFAVSGALTLASAREAPEHQGFAAALAQRLSTLSLVQARLLDRPGSGIALDRLAAELIETLVPAADAVRLAALPRIALDEQRARLVALAIGELCADSLRDGALAASKGTAELAGSAVDRRLVLTWRERPAGREPHAGNDAATRLIARMARAHGGSYACEGDGDGRRARLELPLAGEDGAGAG